MLILYTESNYSFWKAYIIIRILNYFASHYHNRLRSKIWRYCWKKEHRINSNHAMSNWITRPGFSRRGDTSRSVDRSSTPPTSPPVSSTGSSPTRSCMSSSPPSSCSRLAFSMATGDIEIGGGCPSRRAYTPSGARANRCRRRRSCATVSWKGFTEKSRWARAYRASASDPLDASSPRSP